MALNNLSSSLIQNTYEKLVQTEGGLIADGSGSAIDSLTVTASYATQALTASFAENVVPQDTGSLLATASYSDPLLTFTKGDGSTFDVEISTTIDTGSFVTTASISDATLTFTKGDGSTFDTTINNVANATNATNATNADNIAFSADGTNTNRYVPFTATATGDGALLTDPGILYNPSTNKVTTQGPLQIQGVADVSASISSNTTRIGSLEAATGSYAKTNVDNTFTGTQTFDNIAVNGTGSFAYIQSVTGSAKIIGDAYIILNNNTPAERYAGIKVYDSGSTNNSASLEFDGQTNDWFYEYTDDGGATEEFGVVMFGPGYNTRGAHVYPANNAILKGTGDHHITGSIITDDGQLVKIVSPITTGGGRQDFLHISSSDSSVLSVYTPDGTVPGYVETANDVQIRTEGLTLTQDSTTGIVQTRKDSGEIRSQDGSIMLEWENGWINARAGGVTTSTAIGEDSSADSNSVAIGNNADASSESAIAIGRGASADNTGGGTSEGGIAIGNNANATHQHSIAIGNNAVASGSTPSTENMLAMGNNAIVNDSNTAVFKYDNFNFSGSGTATFTGDVVIDGSVTAPNFSPAGTLTGSNYIFVQATGTAIQNGYALKAAYNQATGSTPNGSALAISNRMVVLVAPGNYEFETSNFTLDTEYVDVVSLDGERSVNIVDFDNHGYTININTDHTFVRGFDCTSESNLAFTISYSGGSGIRVENCKGHNNSFGTSQTISGFFKDCECSGDVAFAGNGGIASGTFIRCSVGNLMLGSFSGQMTGLAENCSAQFNLSGYCDNNNGTWMNCDSDSEGWRNGIASSGRVFYCRSGNNGFGLSDGQITGKLFYCVKTATTDPEFIAPGTGGKIIACVDGNDDFVNISG